MSKLDGRFVLHKGPRQRIEVIGDVVDATANAPLSEHVAASVLLPDYRPDTAAAFIAELAARGTVGIADPALHYLEFPSSKRGAGSSHYAYLESMDPYDNPTAFCAAVVDAQIDAGADVLVSPWLTIGLGSDDQSVEATSLLAAETERRADAAGREMVIGLAVAPPTISDSRKRNDLLNVITDEFPVSNVYMRVYLQRASSFTQYSDQPVLEGLATMAGSLRANDRSLLLPQFGLAGWLMMGLGAAGFGSGMSGTLQLCCARTEGQGGRGRPLERYFVADLLGYVLREEYELIKKMPGFVTCPCPFCEELLARPAGAWDLNLAGQHYAWWCAVLAAEVVAAATPRTVVQRRVEGAAEFFDSLRQAGLSLDPRTEPKHLAVWSEVVS